MRAEVENLKAEGEDTLSEARSAVEEAKGEQLLNLFDDNHKIDELLFETAEHTANLTDMANM